MRIISAMVLVTLLSGCGYQDAPFMRLQTCDNLPATILACSSSPAVEVQFDSAGKITGVVPEVVNICNNGKVDFTSNNNSYFDYGILINRDTDNKIKKAGYWSDISTGELEIKVSNKKGCVGYTVIRKLNDGSGDIEYLDPVFLIDH